MPPKSTRLPDPVARKGDVTSLAAQVARAKAVKEMEELELKEKLRKAETGTAPLMRRKALDYRRAWGWGMGFWVWLL